VVTMNEHAIEEHKPQNALAEWQTMKEQASVLVKSGFLPKAVDTPEKAVAIMLSGKELGVPAMQALRGITVIQGTPTIKPELMLALCIHRVPEFTFKWGKCDTQTATFICQRPGMAAAYTSTFTMADAKQAGLLAKGGSWNTYPANMLRWRALANALHAVCPDVLVGVYTPEEFGANVDADGEIINLPDAPEPAKAEPDWEEGTDAPSAAEALAQSEVPQVEAQIDWGGGEQAEPPLLCADCGEAITDYTTKAGKLYTAADVAKYAVRDHGRPLCTSCGFKAKNAKA